METKQHGLSSQHFTLQRLADGVYAALYREGGLAASNAGIINLGDRTFVFDTSFRLFSCGTGAAMTL